MTNAQLRALAREWQKRLRIQDWQIHAEFVASLGDNGDCLVDRHSRIADIRISPNPADQSGRPLDIECVLVHELLHVVFALFEEMTVPEGSKSNPDVEFAINACAQALVELT